MHTDRLVGFVKDGKVEFYAGFSCCRSQLGAALIGREYDLGFAGACAKQCRNLFCVSVRGKSEVVDFTDKFVALKVADRLIAANTKPIWLDAMGKKLTGPIGQALADQREAWHGNENGLGLQCLGNPIGC
jgi:hypothetical protein